MPTQKRQTAYYSYDGGMLAVWIDRPPSCDKDQRDPDGWVSNCAGTEYEAARLAELAHAPDAKLVRAHKTAAEWWAKIDRARKLAAGKAKRKAAREAQATLLIPAKVEDEGRRAAYVRERDRDQLAYRLRSSHQSCVSTSTESEDQKG